VHDGLAGVEVDDPVDGDAGARVQPRLLEPVAALGRDRHLDDELGRGGVVRLGRAHRDDRDVGLGLRVVDGQR